MKQSATERAAEIVSQLTPDDWVAIIFCIISLLCSFFALSSLGEADED